MEITARYNTWSWSEKYKFFFYRLIGYFSFLFVPVYTLKYIPFDQSFAFPMMCFYLLFLVGQWFLLGKEVDYRLKIFFRVNSNMDRIIYRLFLGLSLFIIYFNFLNLFPLKWINNMYWVTWALIGAFFSWPTRGKIIKESVTTNFTEFKYLDSFEKTLLTLTFVMFIFSMPMIPAVESIEELKFLIDPEGKISSLFWSFLQVNFHPFMKDFRLYNLAVSTFFYLIFLGTFLVTFYALLRFFFSRRLSLLGVFALLSSWKYSTILMSDLGATIFSTYLLIWVWVMLWATRALSYRTGLFLGLITFLGALFNSSMFYLMLVQIPLFYFGLFKSNTLWFRKQFLKYSAFGYVLLISVLIIDSSLNVTPFQGSSAPILRDLYELVVRKGFFALSIIGFFILTLKIIFKNTYYLKQFHFNLNKFKELIFFISLYLAFDYVFNMGGFKQYSYMWPIVFLSLIPLEFLFQKISRLRSSRNMIYLCYILICLLDSHFEERVKIFIKIIQN
ncbi:MAG: hypothetical protein DRQ88_05140 [Epsilonproteobacteria bacterium]|nr:MAG: hypothetical protein DRQ89_04615 [Campylobacterota bacterium]RLA66813.1 MAG: hypothetical protein DRQ88_05140 [Campylobacterota bacterium]